MQPQDSQPSVPVEEHDVTRRVAWNQATWTAGYSLTSGGFLTYFGGELGAAGFLMALLLVVPETAATFGLLTRWIVQKLQNRKAIWIGFSIAARVVALLIPLLAFPVFRPAGETALYVMVGLLAVSHALQAVAYLAYISWLSDLVPERHWGRFFAIRNIAKVGVLLVVPVVGGYLRDWWRHSVSDEAALYAYVAAWTIGAVLQVVSLLPLLGLPNLPFATVTRAFPEWRLLRDAFRNRSMRVLLIHNWWLAIANGLTQAAFFLYLFRQLKLGLGTFYILLSVMRLVMIPVSWAAGRLCDRLGNKPPLIAGVIIASSAMLFWLAATPERWWWLFGAYAMWGAFAAVNIAGRNLTLTLAPRSDNTAHLALFRLIGGLLAGVSGLLGGLWLDALLENNYTGTFGRWEWNAFQLLFAVSFLGRITSVLWILPIEESTRTAIAVESESE